MKKLALPFVLLIVAGCAATSEVRWAQAQAEYNEAQRTLNRYRAPCVDTVQYPDAGPDHPLCRLGDSKYVVIEPIRLRVDRLLKLWDDRNQECKQLPAEDCRSVEYDDLLNEAEDLLFSLSGYAAGASE